MLKNRESQKNKKNTHEILLGLAYPNVILKNLFDRKSTSQRILLMSGTCHTTEILTKLFGLNPNEICRIAGKTKISGTVTFVGHNINNPTPYMNIKSTEWGYANFGTIDYQKKYNAGIDTHRKKYYQKMYNIIVAIPKTERILIQTPSKDLIKKILSDERYSGQILYDGIDSNGKNIQNLQYWLEGSKEHILVSTRTSRGIDLKGDKCRHIIIAKCPFPMMATHINSLRRRFGKSDYNLIYLDMTRRILLQQLARGSRNDKDWVLIYTVDIDAAKIILLNLPSKFDNLIGSF